MRKRERESERDRERGRVYAKRAYGARIVTVLSMDNGKRIAGAEYALRFDAVILQRAATADDYATCQHGRYLGIGRLVDERRIAVGSYYATLPEAKRQKHVFNAKLRARTYFSANETRNFRGCISFYITTCGYCEPLYVMRWGLCGKFFIYCLMKSYRGFYICIENRGNASVVVDL